MRAPLPANNSASRSDTERPAGTIKVPALVCRMRPGAVNSAPQYTTAATTSAPCTNGRSRSSPSTPFCITTTEVDGPQSRSNHGAASCVWCAFTPTSTQSTGSVPSSSEGSVTVRAGASTGAIDEVTTYRSNGRRAHDTTLPPMPARWAAKNPPTAPGPTMAMSVTAPPVGAGLRRAGRPRQAGVRCSPARSPRETNLSAILRLASSIISSPNITAPLPSPSVACS